MNGIANSTHSALRNAMQRLSPRSFSHGQRVGLLSAAFGDALGLGRSDVIDLRYAAELHDIGKLALSRGLIDKPGPLDAEEWQAMRRHPELGHGLLRQHENSAVDLASMVALQHHECWDGSGYPYGLKGDAISREARIVALCDIYDALREERSYKPAFSHEQALHFILRGGPGDRVRPAMFDPALLEAVNANAQIFRATYDLAAATGGNT
jgi:HD-GYP domain-containing protein (c-di-GMP phosphodiesterase class II)